jgi:predicted dehydrogenase
VADAWRVGLVGAGWVATGHAEILGRRQETDLVAVCDLDRARAAAIAPPGARVYQRWQELLDGEQLDAVWVCTPPLAHREPAVAALERGIHVYLEKPIARTGEAAEAIVAAAERGTAVCAVGYQWHGTQVLDDLRRALEGQEISLLVGRGIGPTASRPWFLDRSQGGGNVLERGSHHIDLARAIAGDVVSVQAAVSDVLLAQTDGDRGDIEDVATLLLRHESGSLSTIAVGWTREGLPGIYCVDVVATEATLRLTLDPDFTLDGVSRSEQVEARSAEHPWDSTIGRFLEAARAGDGSRVFCTPRDAARTLAVAAACERALKSGETVLV